MADIFEDLGDSTTLRFVQFFLAHLTKAYPGTEIIILLANHFRIIC
jgi:hypothetical protein